MARASTEEDSRVNSTSIERILISRQLNNLESELSEQQKKRVKLVSDAYLDLNINEVRYFNSLLRQRVERTSGIDLAQASSEWPAFKQNGKLFLYKSL